MGWNAPSRYSYASVMHMSKMLKIIESGEGYCTSSVNMHEVLYGIEKYSKDPRWSIIGPLSTSFVVKCTVHPEYLVPENNPVTENMLSSFKRKNPALPRTRLPECKDILLLWPV